MLQLLLLCVSRGIRKGGTAELLDYAREPPPGRKASLPGPPRHHLCTPARPTHRPRLLPAWHPVLGLIVTNTQSTVALLTSCRKPNVLNLRSNWVEFPPTPKFIQKD